MTPTDTHAATAKRCDCYSTNGYLYATPGGWIPCHRCGGTMVLPAPKEPKP